MMTATRHRMHICDALLDIEDRLTDGANLWAQVSQGDGDNAFIVTRGDDPANEPDGDPVVVGVTRVYCEDSIAALVLAALIGESIDEHEA